MPRHNVDRCCSSGSPGKTYCKSGRSTASSYAPRSGFSDAGTSRAECCAPVKAPPKCAPCARLDDRKNPYKPAPKGRNHQARHRSPSDSKTAKAARAQIHNLMHHGTLSKIRGRVSMMTGIPAEYFRGICVHGLMRIYDGCGYEARAISRDAKREAAALKKLRKEAGDDGDREACKMALVKVVARYGACCERRVARMSDRDFRETAVSVICGIAKGRIR